MILDINKFKIEIWRKFEIEIINLDKTNKVK
jgi:hypothetical protein